MKLLSIIVLLGISINAFAVEDYLKETKIEIPSAALARAEAKAIVRIQIANEIPLLRKVVVEEIKETADKGFTMINPDVTDYHPEAIHAVAVELRQKGYYVEWIHSVNPGQYLLVVDWSK